MNHLFSQIPVLNRVPLWLQYFCLCIVIVFFVFLIMMFWEALQRQLRMAHRRPVYRVYETFVIEGPGAHKAAPVENGKSHCQ